jgi:hypothetical protein
VEMLSERDRLKKEVGGEGTHSYVWVRGEDGWVGVYRTGLIVFVQFLRESHPVAPVCHLVSVEEGLMKSVCVRRGRVGVDCSVSSTGRGGWFGAGWVG